MLPKSSLLLLAVGLPAQAAWVVDINGGQGSSFTQIQQGVASVPSGSVLLVRPGTYDAVTINGKALSILCDPGVFTTSPLQPFLKVENTSPTQTVVIHDLKPLSGTPGAQINNAGGLVVYSGRGGVLEATLVAGVSVGPTISVSNSPRVVVRNWVVQGGVQSGPSTVNGLPWEACTISGSTVVFEQCTLRGHSASPMLAGVAPGRSGLVATGSEAVFAGCNVIGGAGLLTGFGATFGAPAITCTNSVLQVLGDSSTNLIGGFVPGGGPWQPNQQPAVSGAGSLRIDPAVRLTGGIAAGIATTTVAQPRVTSVRGVVGGTATARRDGPATLFSALAVGLPAPASSIPGLYGFVWLDSRDFLVAASGPAPATGLPASLTIPNVPTLRGLSFAWQAVDLGPSGLVALSNPSVTFIE